MKNTATINGSRIVQENVEPKVVSISFEMTQDQARVFMGLCGGIRGDLENTVREVTDPIYYKLSSLGIFSLPAVKDSNGNEPCLTAKTF